MYLVNGLIALYTKFSLCLCLCMCTVCVCVSVCVAEIVTAPQISCVIMKCVDSAPLFRFSVFFPVLLLFLFDFLFDFLFSQWPIQALSTDKTWRSRQLLSCTEAPSHMSFWSYVIPGGLTSIRLELFLLMFYAEYGCCNK